jgi:pentatricopeptide repeat protein
MDPLSLVRTTLLASLSSYRLTWHCSTVDLDSVKDVFARLLQDKTVTVTGSHWASLIHAYGTVQKDLPDVICYEALFNAFVAMDRVDLLEKYLNRMKAQFVRPTACKLLFRYESGKKENSANITMCLQIFPTLSSAHIP